MPLRDDMWATSYRYKVYNGVLIAEIKLKMYIPSHMSISGNDVMSHMLGRRRRIIVITKRGTSKANAPVKSDWETQYSDGNRHGLILFQKSTRNPTNTRR